jgi:hypothetical protein
MGNLHEKCGACNRVGDAGNCSVYQHPKAPALWWEHRNGCPMATFRYKVIEEQGKKVNPLKESRRSRRKK